MARRGPPTPPHTWFHPRASWPIPAGEKTMGLPSGAKRTTFFYDLQANPKQIKALDAVQALVPSLSKCSRSGPSPKPPISLSPLDLVLGGQVRPSEAPTVAFWPPPTKHQRQILFSVVPCSHQNPGPGSGPSINSSKVGSISSSPPLLHQLQHRLRVGRPHTPFYPFQPATSAVVLPL